MAFQGMQVSSESFIPLNFRVAPQHPGQFLPVLSAMQVSVLLRGFAVLLHNETLILGTGPGATVCSEPERMAMALTLVLLFWVVFKLKTISSPMQS